ncbi:hypothetical protein JZX87_21505 [Agrobacterium sp. Ap1]|uniref:hypothetical protein n=1 Tax=Agrobacterium sp. Ap1 TaxID=2815337 RepID=UPI001A90BADD|nr:hypothetical protein [Agrobacterium sp. Ap1]MBO0143741.1 hypothetical protein [Agrobacterium sp. Ap1]
MSIDAVLDRILLDLLSDRIIARMGGRVPAKPRSALLLFAETDFGLEAALEQLQQLRDAGWAFETVIAPEARQSLKDRLAGFGAAEVEGKAGDILDQHTTILVPTLSISLAAKVALGIADDPLSKILQGGLERGVRIIAARDGGCPNGRDRRARGLLPNAAYQATMSGHLQRLMDYGIELSWAARLAVAVEGDTLAAAPPIAAPKLIAARTEGVFGLREARSLNATELRLGHAVIVTPAAAEELRARDIALVRE